MLPHSFYNVVHVVGIAALIAALGGMALHGASGGTRTTSGARRLVAVLHGLGALLILVGGFGMLARLELAQGSGFPGWLWIKLVVWGLLAAAAAVPYRRPGLAVPLLVVVPLLAGIAAWAAIYKPM
jgi:hypothetical protein